jgi:uncharacterized protein (DUF2235 family)
MNIIFCADGTCNGPNETDAEKYPDPTNVYRLFVLLSDTPPEAGTTKPLEIEITQQDGAGNAIQAAKYIDGVGDTTCPINYIFGAAQGAGLISRIVRGFTYISRNYRHGDQIHLVGFSRGAYTVRALAGLILHNGLLDPTTYNPDDKVSAYKLGAAAWYDYATTIVTNGIVGDFAKLINTLPSFFFAARPSFVPVQWINAVGVWDTVSSYGFSAEVDATGATTDLFPLANTKLSQSVGRGFQALSIDEQRDEFVPILWDPAPNVVQRLFPGVHADVGGGYSIHNSQAGLSQITLNWMIDNLTGRGVKFYPNTLFNVVADPAGVAHQQWRYVPWIGTKLSQRSFAGRADILVDGAVQMREAAGNVVFDPGDTGVPQAAPVTGRYRPANLP